MYCTDFAAGEVATLGTHSNNVSLLLLDLLRQLIGSTPVSGVCTGNLCLHKEIHSIQLLCNHFLWLMRQLRQPLATACKLFGFASVILAVSPCCLALCYPWL